MNRRRFVLSSIAAGATAAAAPDARVTVLLVDTDRASIPIDKRIYGQFLEHINHSVEDGLFAEQIRGAGFEGPDFETYWTRFAQRGAVEVVDVEFSNGKKSVRLRADGGRADCANRAQHRDGDATAATIVRCSWRHSRADQLRPPTRRHVPSPVEVYGRSLSAADFPDRKFFVCLNALVGRSQCFQRHRSAR